MIIIMSLGGLVVFVTYNPISYFEAQVQRIPTWMSEQMELVGDRHFVLHFVVDDDQDDDNADP